MRISRGMHQLSLGVWFQRLQDNEDSASRQLGQATFASLTYVLQGNIGNTPFQVVPLHTELGWRSLFGAWYVQDTIKLRRKLTARPACATNSPRGGMRPTAARLNTSRTRRASSIRPTVGNSA